MCSVTKVSKYVTLLPFTDKAFPCVPIDLHSSRLLHIPYLTCLFSLCLALPVLLFHTLELFYESLHLVVMLRLLILVVSIQFLLKVGVHFSSMTNQLLIMVQGVEQEIHLTILFWKSESLLTLYNLMNHGLLKITRPDMLSLKAKAKRSICTVTSLPKFETSLFNWKKIEIFLVLCYVNNISVNLTLSHCA